MRSFRTTLFLFLPLILSQPMHAQDLVSHSPQDRSALLEEFSAIHCGNCPAAHVLADQFVSAYPGRVIAAEVHGGSLSVPNGTEPDLRNAAAADLWSHYGVTSQPRGLVDRRMHGGQTVLATSAWNDAIGEVLLLPSPVNIGVSSHFESGSRALSVNVELYYTADGTGGNDRIGVLLKEDHIVGYQQDYVNGAQASYDHNDILRGFITDLWGDEVTMNVEGTTVMRTYTFTVPPEWNIANCEVVAFVGEYQGEVYQARQVAAEEGTTTSMEESFPLRTGDAFPVPAGEVVFIPILNDGVPVNVQLIDQAGRIVRQQRSATNAQLLGIDVGELADGMYTYRLSTTDRMCAGRLVVHH